MNEAINQQEIKKLNVKLIDAEKKLALEMEDKKKREADLEKVQILLKSSLESQRDIGMDLAERKKMEVEIVEAKEYFELIFNTNPDVALVSRLSDGVIVDVNDGFIKMSGYTREEAIGKNGLSMGLFQDMNDRKKITDALMEKGFFEGAEVNFCRKDGIALTGLVSARTISLKGVQHMSISIHDITERKRMEDALRQSEEKYRDIADNISDVIFTIDMNLKTTYVSPSVEKLYGETVADHLKRTIEEKFPPESLKRARLLFLKEIEREKDPKSKKDRTQVIELEHYRADGSIILISMHIAILRDENGKAIGFLGISRDITERKRAEEALIQSESRYRRLFEAAKDGILILDAETGIIKNVNPFLIDLLGYSKEQFIEKAIWDIGLFKDIIANRENFIELQQKGYARYEDLPLQASDGRRIQIEFVSNVYFVDKQKVIQCNVRDITDRKRVEELLRQSEERFQLLFNKAPLGYQSLDFNCNFIDVNQQWLDTLGYTRREVIGKNFIDFLTPEFKDECRHCFQSFLEQGTIHSEFEMIHKNGNKLLIAFEGKVAYDAEGNFKQTHCILQDITEQRKVGEALKESENRYHDFVDASMDMIYLKDDQFRHIVVNKKLADYFEKTIENIIGKTDFELMSKEAAEQCRINDMKAISTRSVCISEEIAGDKVFESIKFPVKLINNKTGVGGYIRDITDRKKAEEALRESEYLYRTFIEASNDIIYLKDDQFRIIVANQAFADYIGKPVKDIIGKTTFELMPKEEAEQYHLSDLKVLESGSVCVFEEHIGNKVAEAIKFPVKLMNQKIGVGGFTHDITDRKLALEALRESERSKSVLLSHIPGLAYRCNYDRDWTMQYLSDGCFALTGYKPESFIGNRDLSYNDLICKEYKKKLWNEWARVLAKKAPFKYEYEITTATGERKWVLEMGQGIFDPDGNVEALEGIVIDITESKQRFNQIQYMNDHDFMTGLYNRKYFEEAKKQLDKEKCLPLSIIIADIDGLRLINDAFGHAEGDRTIIETAKIIQSFCREGDILARTGGDEFSILLPNTDREAAIQVQLSIKKACEEFNSPKQEKANFINLSIGYGVKQTKEQDIDEAETEAEEYLSLRKLLERKSHQSAILIPVMATMYARSHETEEHAERLATLSNMIGKKMQLSQHSLDELKLFSMLHDIGKVGIDDRILNKPSKLTSKECTEMKKHSEVGYRIVMSAPELEPVAEYILSHHERWDGRGYPQGLKGEEIPLLSRILSVVDAYDAMMEDRVYRKALTKEAAIEQISKNAGTQFDPWIAKLFIENIT